MCVDELWGLGVTESWHTCYIHVWLSHGAHDSYIHMSHMCDGGIWHDICTTLRYLCVNESWDWCVNESWDSCVDELWHTYYIHVWMSHETRNRAHYGYTRVCRGACVHESWHTCYVPAWMSHGTCVDESRDMCRWVTRHVWMSHETQQSTPLLDLCVNASCKHVWMSYSKRVKECLDVCVNDTHAIFLCKWVAKHNRSPHCYIYVWMSHETRNESWDWCVNESWEWHTYYIHVWMSHETRNRAHYGYTLVCRGTCVHESWHTCYIPEWMCHGTCVDESWDTAEHTIAAIICEWVMQHVWMSCNKRVNESLDICENESWQWEWVKTHVTHPSVHASRDMCVWVMTHNRAHYYYTPVWVSHEACVCMSHGTQQCTPLLHPCVSESWDTCVNESWDPCMDESWHTRYIPTHTKPALYPCVDESRATTSKQPNTHNTSPKHMKWALNIWNEPCIHMKTALYPCVNESWDIIWKEPYTHNKSPTHIKRALYTH